MTQVKIIDSDFDKALYNKAAKHPIQSWEWGNARSDMGLEILRLGEFEDSELKKSYLCTFHTLPVVKKKLGYLGMCHIPSPQLLEFLKTYGKEHGIVFFKFEPDIFEDQLESQNWLENLDLKKSSAPNFYEWTYTLDLKLDEKQLLSNLKNTWRYNIGLAGRKGVEIIQDDTEEGFKAFSKVFFDTAKRQGYSGHSQNYHQKIWDNLKGSIAHILYAKYKGDVVAAGEFFFFNDRFYYPYGGSLPIHREVKSPNLLVWSGILLGKSLNASVIDLWGIAPPGDNDHEWARVTEFKSGFGGERRKLVGSYDFVLNGSVYFLYTIAFRARKIAKRIKG
jgi:lipid II:glycine glycyltransferase (peptidoglycan interpeptide bridge formation enzyme)